MRPSDTITTGLGGLLGVLFVVFGPTLTQAQTVSDDKLAAALQGLDEVARKTIETGGVPGLAIAVVYDDKVVYLKGFGHREAGKLDLVDADTVFQLASMSKPISATIVAALVSEGVVGWDSRISDIDSGFPSPETPDMPSAVRFTIGPDGRATDVTIDSLNDVGLGTLKRAAE